MTEPDTTDTRTAAKAHRAETGHEMALVSAVASSCAECDWSAPEEDAPVADTTDTLPEQAEARANRSDVRVWTERESALARDVRDLAAALRAERQRADRLQAAILDIDAHATPYGEDKDGFVSGGYLITVGSLHRALGKVGHTAPKCDAEAELVSVRVELVRVTEQRDTAHAVIRRCVNGETPDIEDSEWLADIETFPGFKITGPMTPAEADTIRDALKDTE